MRRAGREVRREACGRRASGVCMCLLAVGPLRDPPTPSLQLKGLGPLLTANDMEATAHAASKHPRGGLGLGAGAEGAGGVGGCGEGRSWWSIEFDQSISDWLGRCLYPHSRACAYVIPG